jgi:hypothetical protein
MNDFTKDEFNTMAWCATRYALGRKTYVVSDICNILINYADYLDKANKDLMSDEISKAIDDGHAGMSMDVEQWKKVLEKFEDE